jgi:protein-L-isoaspartate(D-aspartate) O-methyltransferase
VVLTGSTPILPEGFLRQVAPGGRLFAVIGDLPVMKARLMRRDAAESLTTRDLFETVLDPLKHAAAPARFEF